MFEIYHEVTRTQRKQSYKYFVSAIGGLRLRGESVRFFLTLLQ
jgi:hypothetical protein